MAVHIGAGRAIRPGHFPGEEFRCPIKSGQEGVLREVVFPNQRCLHLGPRGLRELMPSLCKDRLQGSEGCARGVRR